MKNGISGSTSRFQGNFPRCHQKTTSKAAGRLAMTVFDINPSRNSPKASGIISPASVSIKSQIGQRRAQIEHSRQRVLEFRNPRHRFHLNRMQGKEGRRQPRARYFQLPQYPCQQQRRKSMEQNVDPMITRRGIAPKLVLHPKNTVNQRIVLLGGPELRPNAGQTVQRTEFRLGYVLVIVPDQSGVPRRLIGHYGEGQPAKTQAANRCRHDDGRNPTTPCLSFPFSSPPMPGFPADRARRFGRFHWLGRSFCRFMRTNVTSFSKPPQTPNRFA